MNLDLDFEFWIYIPTPKIFGFEIYKTRTQPDPLPSPTRKEPKYPFLGQSEPQTLICCSKFDFLLILNI